MEKILFEKDVCQWLNIPSIPLKTFSETKKAFKSGVAVTKLFDDKYKGVINNKEFEIYSSLYEQEGLNSTLCWNVEFSLQHNILLDSESPILRKADISGNIIIGG